MSRLKQKTSLIQAHTRKKSWTPKQKQFRTIDHYMCYRWCSRMARHFWSRPSLCWWQLCGLEVTRGQRLWLVRLGAACCPCHWKWASPVGSVCYRRSNGPLGNLLVPTVCSRDLYLSQSGIKACLWTVGKLINSLVLLSKKKMHSGSWTEQVKAYLMVTEQFGMWKFYLRVKSLTQTAVWIRNMVFFCLHFLGATDAPLIRQIDV